MKNYILDFLKDNGLEDGEEFSIQKPGDNLLFDKVRFRIDQADTLIDEYAETYGELLIYLLMGQLVVKR